MSFFKPVAGLIVLVFVLVVIYSEYSTNKETELQQKAVSQREVAATQKQESYERCIAAVDSNMVVRRMQYEKAYQDFQNDGTLDRDMNDCIVRYDGILTKPPASLSASNPNLLTQHNNMIRNTCEGELNAKYDYEDEIAAETLEEKQACKLRLESF